MVREVPEFLEVYNQHIRDNGEILPHVLMGDFTRFVISCFRERKNKPEFESVFSRGVDLIEELVDSGDDQLEELAQVSFLENLHQAGSDYSEIRGCLGKYSKKRLEVLENGDR